MAGAAVEAKRDGTTDYHFSLRLETQALGEILRNRNQIKNTRSPNEILDSVSMNCSFIFYVTHSKSCELLESYLSSVVRDQP